MFIDSNHAEIQTGRRLITNSRHDHVIVNRRVVDQQKRKLNII